MEKRGDDQEKKFFMGNTVHALIPFKERHRSLLKLHGGRNFSVGKKGRNFLRSGKITYGEAFQNLLKSCISFGCQKKGRRILMKKNWGKNRMKKLYSKTWGNTV